MAEFGRNWLADMDAMLKQTERLLDHFSISKPPPISFARCAFDPAIDIYETDEAVVVLAEMAGLAQDDFEIIVERTVLSLRGERKNPATGQARVYSRMEICYGPFEKHVDLPASVDVDGTEASYRDGYLRVVLPKMGSPSEVKVKIQNR